MYMEYLKLSGFSVIGAVDGATAIEAARSHHPAVIVMDLSMPGVDGCSATRALKVLSPGARGAHPAPSRSRQLRRHRDEQAVTLSLAEP